MATTAEKIFRTLPSRIISARMKPGRDGGTARIVGQLEFTNRERRRVKVGYSAKLDCAHALRRGAEVTVRGRFMGPGIVYVFAAGAPAPEGDRIGEARGPAIPGERASPEIGPAPDALEGASSGTGEPETAEAFGEVAVDDDDIEGSMELGHGGEDPSEADDGEGGVEDADDGPAAVVADRRPTPYGEIALLETSADPSSGATASSGWFAAAEEDRWSGPYATASEAARSLMPSLACPL